MESLVNDKLLQNINPKRGKTVPKAASTMEPVVMGEAEADISVRSRGSTSRGKPLDVSGPMGPYPAQLKNHWYPAAFSADIDDKTMVIPYSCTLCFESFTRGRTSWQFV